MTTTIVHISDLHFPARKLDQPKALADSIASQNPDLIVVSGDLTRSGRHCEFREAAKFLGELPVPKIVVAGNHDVPVPAPLARLTGPFRRFDNYFPNDRPWVKTSEVFVVGFNSAVGM